MTQLACPAERFLDSVGAFSRRSSRKQPPLIHANADEQGRANTVKGVAVIRGADPNTIGGAIVGKVAVWCCQSDATPVAWFRPETAGSTLIVTVLLVPGDIVPSRQVTSAHCVQPFEAETNATPLAARQESRGHFGRHRPEGSLGPRCTGNFHRPFRV